MLSIEIPVDLAKDVCILLDNASHPIHPFKSIAQIRTTLNSLIQEKIREGIEPVVTQDVNPREMA